MDWLELVKAIWPIASTVTPLILLGGFLWLKTKFPSKEELDAFAAQIDRIDQRVDDHEVRVAKVEQDQRAEPTRADLNRVQASLSERIGGVEGTLRAMGHQLTRIDNYLHTLIEKGLDR